MKVKDILVESPNLELDEALTSTDISKVEDTFVDTFKAAGTNIYFSPHFKVRMDERSEEESIEIFAKTLGQVYLTDTLKKAFSYGHNLGIDKQKSRIINASISGRTISIQVNRGKSTNGQMYYEFETLYVGERLSQGRNIVQYNEMPPVPKGIKYADMVRQASEKAESGFDKNIWGYDKSQKLNHIKETNVFNVVYNYVALQIEDIRKTVEDIVQGKSNDIERANRAASLLSKSLTTLSAQNIIDNTRDLQAVVNLGSKNNFRDAEQARWALNKCRGAIDDLKSQISEVKRHYDGLYGRLLSIVDPDKKANGHLGIPLEKFIERFGEEDKRIASEYKMFKAIIRPFATFIEQNRVLSQTLTDKHDRYKADELGIMPGDSISKLTGKIVNSPERGAARTAAMNKSRQAYKLSTQDYRQSELSGLQGVIGVLRSLLPKVMMINPKDEYDELLIGELNQVSELIASKNYSDAGKVLGDVISTSSSMNTPLAKKLNTQAFISVADRLRQTSNLKEETQMNKKVKKYAMMLIGDLNIDRSTHQYSHWSNDGEGGYDGGEEWHYGGEIPQVLEKIPKALRKDAQKLAFAYLIKTIKADQSIADIIRDRGEHYSWIPRNIRTKLLQIVDQYDEQDSELKSKHEVEKKKFSTYQKNVNETSAYLRGEKDKIDKKSMQTPLNKRGFGV